MEFTRAQLQTLARLQQAGFFFISFPMYASYVGVRRGDCACLLAGEGGATFRIFGEASWLLSGNLTVRVMRRERSCFVWKNQSLEATAERLAELRAFAASLHELLAPPAD